MSLKGNLASVNLTEIFQMLSLSGREGTLFIYEGARKRAICFTKEGVSIRSRERNEANLIGKILVRLGKIDERDLQRAVETRRRSDCLLGDLLVGDGLCTREDVELALRIQSEEEIQELFLNRSDAQFEYIDGYFPESEIPFVSLNVNSLLIEIARRTDEWEYIRRRIRGPREIYRFTGAEGTVEADVLAECYAHRVDALIDGSHSVGDIIDASYVNKYEVCKLIACYLDAGIVEQVPPDAVRHNARLALRMGDTESAIRHYEYLMTTGDFPLDVMAEAAEAHEANRDYAEAAALLRRLAEELVRAGDYRGAMDALRAIAAYPRPEPEALRYLMDLVFENPRAAAEFASSIVEAGKTLTAYYINHEQQGDAIELLERLLGSFPDEVAFATSLVNVYYEEGNLQEAATQCERLANSFLKRKRPTHAVSLYKKLLVIDPERQDIRDKIRKIVSGKKKRPMSPALPRLLVTVAITVLVTSVALVVYDRRDPGGNTGPTLGPGTQGVLFGRLASEQSSAAELARNINEDYTRLVELVDRDVLANREGIVTRLRGAENRYKLFDNTAEKAIQIAETVIEQTSDSEAHARAHATREKVKDLRKSVVGSRARWQNEAQLAAQALYEQGIELYEDGRLGEALERFTLAREIATRKEWLAEKQLDQFIANIRRDAASVEQKMELAKQREDEGDWPGARRIYLELLKDFEGSDMLKGLRLPVEILTIPPGAMVCLDGEKTPKPTPCVQRLPLRNETKVELRLAGFESKSYILGPFGPDTDPARYQYISDLRRKATWVRSIRGHIQSDPTAFGSRLAVVERNGRWYVFDARSGKPIANDELDVFDGVSAGLVSRGTEFFVPALDGKLFAFDGVKCRVDWRTVPTDAQAAGYYARPVIADDVIYVVDQTGVVTARDLSKPPTENLLWKKRAGEGIIVRAAPAVQGEDLVITATSGLVTVFRRKTGDVVTRYRLEGSFVCAPALVGSDDLVFASEQGTLTGVNRVTGTINWGPRNVGTTALLRTPPIKGRAVFVSPQPGRLVAFDTRTGDEIYRYSRTHAAARAAVMPKNRIFFADGRVLSAFAPRADGYGLAWTFEAQGRILAGPVVNGDAVFIADEKGHLYRLEAND
jgi:outer membrane protein assembly factor BamB/tetratricopeptide (TPR) repeat protein